MRRSPYEMTMHAIDTRTQSRTGIFMIHGQRYRVSWRPTRHGPMITGIDGPDNRTVDVPTVGRILGEIVRQIEGVVYTDDLTDRRGT